jgi:hypothetical protein
MITGEKERNRRKTERWWCVHEVTLALKHKHARLTTLQQQQGHYSHPSPSGHAWLRWTRWTPAGRQARSHHHSLWPWVLPGLYLEALLRSAIPASAWIMDGGARSLVLAPPITGVALAPGEANEGSTRTPRWPSAQRGQT